MVPGNKTLLTINMDNVVGKGLAEIAVRAFVPGVDTLVRTLRIYYTATNLNEFTTLTPADGTTGGSVLPNFPRQPMLMLLFTRFSWLLILLLRRPF